MRLILALILICSTSLASPSEQHSYLPASQQTGSLIDGAGPSDGTTTLPERNAAVSTLQSRVFTGIFAPFQQYLANHVFSDHKDIFCQWPDTLTRTEKLHLRRVIDLAFHSDNISPQEIAKAQDDLHIMEGYCTYLEVFYKEHPSPMIKEALKNLRLLKVMPKVSGGRVSTIKNLVGGTLDETKAISNRESIGLHFLQAWLAVLKLLWSPVIASQVQNTEAVTAARELASSGI